MLLLFWMRLFAIVAFTYPVVFEGPLTLKLSSELVLLNASAVTVLLDSTKKSCSFSYGRRLNVVELLAPAYREFPLQLTSSVNVPDALAIHCML
jgi:hypothetical protein